MHSQKADGRVRGARPRARRVRQRRAASPGRRRRRRRRSRDMTIEVVTHGQASDPFWSVVKNGVDQAATDLGITVNYSRPGDLRHGRHGAADRRRRGRRTRWARDLEPGPGSARLTRSRAPRMPASRSSASTRASMPTRSSASSPTSARPSSSRARGPAQRMAEAGVTNALCVNQEVGNAGARPALRWLRRRPRRRPVEVVGVDLTDPTGAQNAIEAAHHRTIRPSTASSRSVRPAPRRRSRPSRATTSSMLATFDLSPEVLDRDRGRHDPVRHRPAAVPAGLPGRPHRHPVRPVRPAARRRPADPDRPWVRRPGDTPAQVIELSAQGIR